MLYIINLFCKNDWILNYLVNLILQILIKKILEEENFNKNDKTHKI